MTIMPAQLITANQDDAILLTLHEFKRRDLTLNEARSDLALLLDPDHSEAHRQIAWLQAILLRVEDESLSADAAVTEIRRLIGAPVAQRVAELN